MRSALRVYIGPSRCHLGLRRQGQLGRGQIPSSFPPEDTGSATLNKAKLYVLNHHFVNLVDVTLSPSIEKLSAYEFFNFKINIYYERNTHWVYCGKLHVERYTLKCHIVLVAYIHFPIYQMQPLHICLVYIYKIKSSKTLSIHYGVLIRILLIQNEGTAPEFLFQSI